MSCRSPDARHLEAPAAAPSVSGMTQVHPESTPNWARVLRWAGPIFGIAWLWPLVLAFAVSDPSGSEIVLVAVGLTAFAALFLVAVMTERPLLPLVIPMLAIAVGLTLAIDDAFGWLFAWAGSAATVRLGDTRDGAKA